jgi:ferredoxin
MSDVNVQQNGVILEGKDFSHLFDALKRKGYRLAAPVARDGAIVLDYVTEVNQLPLGLRDEQDGGKYRLEQTGNPSLFGFTVGQQSWKKFLYAATKTLWKVDLDTHEYIVPEVESEFTPTALIGVRSCDLHAIAIHDQILSEGPHHDPHYVTARSGNFIVAVNCTRAGGTCFCASVGTGPRATRGYDIALTEMFEEERHYFLAESGSEAGVEVLGELRTTAADDSVHKSAAAAIDQAARSMGRELKTNALKEQLDQQFDNLHWDEIARRCLSCGNCTMVCPTCFCVTVEDSTNLSGNHAERVRKWDSCFTLNFSYIHGGSIRPSVTSRYRQWMMHKLSYWQDQFGTLGCIGCGRCITWCPVGIDITEEARTFQESA